MTKSRFMFLIKWVFPAAVSALTFSIVFIYNLVIKILTEGISDEEIVWSEAGFAFLSTFIGGVFCGFAYSLYRPFLRRLGRISGDILTGAIAINFYFIAIYEFLQYQNYSQGLADGFIHLLLMASLLGGLAGWNWNITKIENNLIDSLRDRYDQMKKAK